MKQRFKKQKKIQKGWIFSILIEEEEKPRKKKNDYKDIRERKRILKREKTR